MSDRRKRKKQPVYKYRVYARISELEWNFIQSIRERTKLSISEIIRRCIRLAMILHTRFAPLVDLIDWDRVVEILIAIEEEIRREAEKLSSGDRDVSNA